MAAAPGSSISFCTTASASAKGGQHQLNSFVQSCVNASWPSEAGYGYGQL
jgi:hypothetical protein